MNSPSKVALLAEIDFGLALLRVKSSPSLTLTGGLARMDVIVGPGQTRLMVVPGGNPDRP